MISKAVYSILSTTAGVTSLVGTKIYPVQTPQAVTAPFMIYSISGTPIDDKDGVATQELFDLQITIFSATYENAHAIRAAVRTALDRKSGTYQNNKIETIVYQDERDNGFDTITKLYKIDVAFEIRRNN